MMDARGMTVADHQELFSTGLEKRSSERRSVVTMTIILAIMDHISLLKLKRSTTWRETTRFVKYLNMTSTANESANAPKM